MAETAIQWTATVRQDGTIVPGWTFNPWIGCTHKHLGCLRCYAEADMDKRRKRVKWGPHGTRSRTSDSYWKQPLKWDREAAEAGERRRVFCASLADVFEDWPGQIVDSHGNVLWRRQGKIVSAGQTTPSMSYGERPATTDDLRADLFQLIDRTPNLDWLLLTKRPENVRRMWPRVGRGDLWLDKEGGIGRYVPFRNAWLGYSASDQKTLDDGAGDLVGCKDLVSLLFLSLEPLLAEVSLSHKTGTCGHLPGCLLDEIGWVIVGGESDQGGQKARPCNVGDVRSVVRQCRQFGCPVFVKQLGSNVVTREGWPHVRGDVTKPRTVPDGFGNYRVHLIDGHGGGPEEWPEDLRIRQWPGVDPRED